MIAAAVCLLVSVAMGTLLAGRLIGGSRLAPRWAAWLLLVCLGVGLGFGLASLLFFLALSIGAGSPWVVVAVEAAAVAALATFRERAAPAPAQSGARERWLASEWSWVAGLGLGVVLLLGISGLAALAIARPHGEWDAWAIWNVRAKFLGDVHGAWRNAISPLLNRTHPDYPLLISGWVGLLWKAAGQYSPAVPVVTHFLFAFSALGVVVSGVAILRSTLAGLLAGLVLLSSPAYQIQAAAQYADIPVAFYYVAALLAVLLAASEPTGGPGRLFAAGLFAGCAAWTKNEGIPFIVVLLACLVLVDRRGAPWRDRLARLRPAVLGAAGPLAVVALLKALAPVSEPMFQQGGGVAALKAVDPTRYALIVASILRHVWDWGMGLGHPVLMMAIVVIAFGWCVREPARLPMLRVAATLAATLVAYMAAYALSVQDLNWRLSTSMVRLLAHLWPAVVLLFVLGLDGRAPSPEAVTAGARVRQGAASQKVTRRKGH